MQIGFRRAPEGREMRPGNGFGQDGNRSYEERQRVPGDYDAQISIHDGIARHALDHLAATDRGVIMGLTTSQPRQFAATIAVRVGD
jgi:hypothetical protein